MAGLFRDRGTGRSAAARRRKGLHPLRDRGVYLPSQPLDIELEVESLRELHTVASRGQQAFRQGNSGRCTQAGVAVQNSDQRDVVDAISGDSTRQSLACALDAGYVEMRQEIVDPLVVGLRGKPSHINVIVPH